MASGEHNASQIELAAGEALGSSGPHLAAAKEYAEKFSEMGTVPFGVVPSLFLMPSYEAGRQSQIDNLGDGIGKLQEMAEGLAEVARRYRKAEKANTMKPRNPEEVEVKKPDPGVILDEGAKGLIGLEAGLLGTGFMLSRFWAPIALANTSSAKLVPTALVGSAAWFTCLPKPWEIGQAIATWSKVAEELGHVDIARNVETALNDTDWTSGARMQFNRWVDDFDREVEEAKGAADATKVTLMIALFLIVTLNIALLGFALVTLATIIAATIAEKFPPTSAPATIAKYMSGTVLSLANVETVGSVSMALKTAGFGVTSAVTTGLVRGFGKMEVKKGGGEDTFVDLDIDWDRLK